MSGTPIGSKYRASARSLARVRCRAGGTKAMPFQYRSPRGGRRPHTGLRARRHPPAFVQRRVLEGGVGRPGAPPRADADRSASARSLTTRRGREPGLAVRLVGGDLVLVAHGEADVVEALEQAPLGEVVEVEGGVDGAVGRAHA